MKNAEPSTLRLWLVRVVIPAVLVIGVGLFVTQPPTALVKPDGDLAGERLHKIGLAINDATAGLGRPPANIEELRPFLEDQGDPDALVVSPADGLPFVVFWGVDVRTAAYDTVIAYEQLGSAGKRFVLTASGVVRLTDDELATADFPAGHQPP